jgi:Dolichyl-phosphate-mannose-protein mannosyltransferase
VTERLRAVPAWVWLVVIVIGSFSFRAWLSRHMLAPFIMTDELIYSELGKSLAATHGFEIREYPVTGYGLLYSALISPAYALFDSLTDAYAAVKVINSLVMSLAAVPAYLIARRVVAPPLALLAALLAVALPSLVYTATVMTENAYYPLTLLVAWATLVALDEPRWRSSVLVAVALGLALATRSQALALAAGIILAPFVLALIEGSGLARVRASWRLYALFGGTAFVVLVGQFIRGHSLQDLLGAYGVVGDRSYDVGLILRFWLWHAEELTLYLGVVPVVATLVLLGRARTLPARVQEHLAVTVSFSLWTTLVVAAFASEFAGRVQERNAFAVAPLLLTALVAWVSLGAPRPWPLVAVSAGLAIALVVAFPYTRFIDEPAKSDTLAILPIWSSYGHLLLGSIWFSVLLGAVGITAVFVLVPARWAVLVPVTVLVWFGVVGQSVWSGNRGFVQAGAGALFQGIRGVPRDWIDSALPDGATTGIVWTGLTDRFTVNQNEFFNRSVGPVYYIGGPTPGNLPETGITVDPDDGILRRADGSPVTDRYLVTDASIELDGQALARDLPLGLTLWEVAGGAAHKVDVTWTGLYPNDTWSGPAVRYVRKNCTPGVLQVSLHSDASLFRIPQTVVASVAGRSVARVRFQAPEDAVLRVPLVPDADGACRVTFDASPTAVPGRGDDRRLGVHFDAFNYESR